MREVGIRNLVPILEKWQISDIFPDDVTCPRGSLWPSLPNSLLILGSGQRDGLFAGIFSL